MSFGVNSLLPDSTKIKNSLVSRDLYSVSDFRGASPPGYRTVAISKYLDNATIKDILDLITDLGFEYYLVYDNIEQEISEDVLIGAYGGQGAKIGETGI